MYDEEIEIPKSVRPVMMDGAKETKLGEMKGAMKQYRYGNLHIREYDDRYMVHMDKVDPRKDPFGHLMRDSPEILIATASSICFARKIGSDLFKNRKQRPRNVFLGSLIMGAITSMTVGCLGYHLGKRIKKLK